MVTVKAGPLYCFGYLNDDLYPRPLVLDSEGLIWRPTTQEEFVEHKDEIAKNILLDRVLSLSVRELEMLLERQRRAESMTIRP